MPRLTKTNGTAPAPDPDPVLLTDDGPVTLTRVPRPTRSAVEPETFVLQKIGRSAARIQIQGTAPLIVNNFSQKARGIMLDKQMGKAVVREAKNPEQCYRDSLYIMPAVGKRPERYGFPATGYKAAIADAARYFKGSKLTMTDLKRMIFVKGEGPEMLVEIGGEPEMRQDMVRNATGVADIRFRGVFWPWAATLEVVYLRTTLTLGSIIALVDAAGIGGVGEWRPSSKESKSGMFGTWEVVDEAAATEILL